MLGYITKGFRLLLGQPTMVAPSVSRAAAEPTPSLSIDASSVVPVARQRGMTEAEFCAAEILDGDRDLPVSKYRDEPLVIVAVAEHARQMADLLTMESADSLRFGEHEIRTIAPEGGGSSIPHIIVTDRQFRAGYLELCADNNWQPHKHEAVAQETRRLLKIVKRYAPGYKCSETGRHLGRAIEYRIPCSAVLRASKPVKISASIGSDSTGMAGTVVALPRKGGQIARVAA